MRAPSVPRYGSPYLRCQVSDRERAGSDRPLGSPPVEGHGFEHEALLYAGDDELVERLCTFVREGLEEGASVLVMVGARKVALLRAALGDDAPAVRFADMEVVGRNPARIIPAWREFADECSGRPVRGIGEPIWAERSATALVECQTHEQLLNVAFADAARFRLLCPYDTSTLDAEAIDEALRSHPVVSDGDVSWTSTSHLASDAARAGLTKPLPSAPAGARELGFDIDRLAEVRALVAAEATAAGLGPARVDDVVLAASEAAANSVRHGGGQGTVRVWRSGDAFVCELCDGGRIEDPLVGRVAPLPGPDGGQGLWVANHLCDLVQLRSFADGAVARLHVLLPG
jgi:anti-sigma regulatory factor (Ser/Thr protein kinase)